MQYPADIFLEYEAQLASESMGNPAKKDGGIDWKWLIPTVLSAIALVGGCIWGLHYEFSNIATRLGDIDKHIARVETAVRIVGAKQGGDTKTLIDEALTVAKNAAKAGHTDNAKALVAYANQLIEEQKQSKADAPQQFFEAALTHYQSLKGSPELRDSAQAGTLALAEYRSAIIPPPSAQGTKASIGEMRRLGQFTYLKDSYFIGNNALFTSPQGTDIDYLILDNVTFENATIVYRGKPIVLKNVRFINCRFVVSDSPTGDELLAAAIKQPATAKIG